MLKKIVFMGTPSFAVPVLKSMYQNGYQVTCVYTQAPQKSNRGMKLTKSPVHLMAETLGLDVRTPKNFKNNFEEYDFLKNLNIDLVIVVAYGQLIPEKFLNLSKGGFINIHASLLPKYRGAAPIQRAIINMENETGITIMKINSKLDQGQISNSYKININEKDSTEYLSEKLSALAAEKILDVIDDILENKIIFKEQDHAKASYAKKINKNEASIDWNFPAKNIIAKINALNGAYFFFKGSRYKILEAEINSLKGNPGEVVSEDLVIACKENSIKVLLIQREGKRLQKTSEFLLGSQIKKGSLLLNV